MGFRGTRFCGFSFGVDSFVITNMGLFWGVPGVDLDDLRGGLVLFFLVETNHRLGEGWGRVGGQVGDAQGE